MDNDSIHVSTDKSGLINAEGKLEDQNAANDEKQNSSASATAHRSCPNLSLSMSLESLIRNFERERTSSATINNKSNANDISHRHQTAAGGVPLCSANLLLPTPKTTTMLDAALMSRICKSMNNIDALSRSKKPFHFLLNKQPGAEVTEDEFFELIERLNANRLQDQRAEFPPASKEDTQNGGEADDNGQDKTLNANADQLLTMIMMHQSRRYDDQRASPVLSDYETQEILRRLSLRTPNENERIDKKAMDDQLYELIMSYQGGRLEDQRSELGGRKAENSQSGKLLEKKGSKKKAKKTNSTSGN